jgi:RNA polymerase sigma-70 factor (ECF subfamily)
MSDSRQLPIAEPERPIPIDWGAALTAHQGWLRRVVVARLGEPQAVDEVMQEVALAAVAQHSPLQNPTATGAWLYRLAVRSVLLYRRKTGRQRSLVGRYALRNGASEFDAARSPLGWLLREERQRLVQQALQQLPPRDAQLLILKHADGFGARELAERLGVTVATIETRLLRARRRLRAVLAGLSDEFEAPHDDRF